MFKKILLGLDVFLNVVFNGRVETISARAGRAARHGKKWGQKLCQVLDIVDDNHCEDADNASPFKEK